MQDDLLHKFYDHALEGLPGIGTPAQTVYRFRTTPMAIRADAERIIGFYVGLSGMTGFVCGAPGLLLVPITLPVNLAGVALLQLHMCAALAILNGHNPHDPATRERSIGCLLEHRKIDGQVSEDEEIVNRTGMKLFERAVRILAEGLTPGVRRLPLLGGLIGASADVYSTLQVGGSARVAFLPLILPPESESAEIEDV